MYGSMRDYRQKMKDDIMCNMKRERQTLNLRKQGTSTCFVIVFTQNTNAE